MAPRFHSPLVTPRAARLGRALRQLRGSTTAADAAYHMRMSPSWISRVEAGAIRPDDAHLVKLLALYGVRPGDPHAAEIFKLAATEDTAQWWRPLEGVLAPRDLTYLAFEDEAQKITSYEVTLIPGLLQTEDYAREILRTGWHIEDEKIIALRLDARMDRQRIFARKVPTTLHAIISEAAFRFEVGGPAVHLGQMRHLASMAEQPNITIQVAPFTAGAVPAAQSGFVVLDFGPADRQLAGTEQQQASMWLTQDPDEVAQYVARFDTLMRHTLSAEESAHWIWERSWNLT